jgi:hypothetical protein
MLSVALASFLAIVSAGSESVGHCLQPSGHSLLWPACHTRKTPQLTMGHATTQNHSHNVINASAFSATMAGKADVDPTPYLNKWVGEPCTSAHAIHRLLRHRNFCSMHTDMSSSAHNTTLPHPCRLLRRVHDMSTHSTMHKCAHMHMQPNVQALSVPLPRSSLSTDRL